MSTRRALPLLAAALLCIAAASPIAAAGESADPGHPALLPELDPDGPFPRFTVDDLARHGFPDHQHRYFWPEYEPPRDADGREYGIGSLCSGIVSKERPDLETAPGLLGLGRFTLAFKQDAAPCYVAPYLGLCEMAERDLARVLDLTPPGNLHIVSHDDMAAYTAATGLGPWRMFALAGDTCQVQPVGILARRTLIGHAAWDMTARWTLDRQAGALPLWLRDGIAAWFAELGVHLVNYMAQPRLLELPVLQDPAQTQAVLAGPPLADPEADRLEYRRARYNAFLMVWRLVEHHGGVANLRALIHAVRDGEDADAACRRVYGTDPAGLALLLDPRVHGEPLGGAVQQRNPAGPPEAGTTSGK